MPELPEVETTRRGVAPFVEGRRVVDVRVREPRLRWPVPPALAKELTGQRIVRLSRRAKYLLFEAERGCLIVHLGMSGSLRLVPNTLAPEKHDHFDLCLEQGQSLRYHDPRRFGAALWTRRPPLSHALLSRLGPEPLEHEFDGAWLYRAARKRRAAVKSLLMDSHVVVGVGNIYANESLFVAGIHPARAAGRISKARYELLAGAVKHVLGAAIAEGGTTLRDFVNSDGNPGYFYTRLNVYAHAGDPCSRCATPIKQRVIGQRSTFYCPKCQR